MLALAAEGAIKGVLGITARGLAHKRPVPAQRGAAGSRPYTNSSAANPIVKGTPGSLPTMTPISYIGNPVIEHDRPTAINI